MVQILLGKKVLKSVTGFLVFIMVSEFILMYPFGNVIAEDVKEEEVVKLKVGTPLILKLSETVSSENRNAGDMVQFYVAEDVIVDDKVVIKRGAPARGEVLTTKKKEFAGQKGEVTLGIHDVEAVDGQRVRLRSTKQGEGEGKMAMSIALSVVVCPLFLLMKGKEAVIPEGTEVKVFVDYEADIKTY